MSNSNSTPIVVVAFNRPNSLKRMLSSLGNAEYPDNDITLIISIDYSPANNELQAIAHSFSWVHGEKIIDIKKTNLGLRQHILLCGDYANSYGSVIILEDDLFVSKMFYKFAIAALKFSEGHQKIGGISLYNHKFNVHTSNMFSSIDDGYDNWYFQFASSWGQAWSKDQWNSFINWYNKNPTLSPSPLIPNNVINWSEKSWLKYFIIFLIETDRYFMYPKSSLSTNFSDSGTHVGTDSTAYQVELCHSIQREYFFSEFEKSESIYDAFFENINLNKSLNLDRGNLCIDLYAYKNWSNYDFLLTTKILNFEILKSFGKSLKPIDSNMIHNIVGEEIFLYNLRVQRKNIIKINKFRRIIYNIKYISLKDSIFITIKLFKLRIIHVFNKLNRMIFK